MTDVMSRLLAVEPLPRGERLARNIDRAISPQGNRLWWRMINPDNPIYTVIAAVAQMTSRGVRNYARPLNKARVERRLWRKEALRRIAPARRQGEP